MAMVAYIFSFFATLFSVTSQAVVQVDEINAISTEFCKTCPEVGHLAKTSAEVMTFAKLNEDLQASLSSSFTLCSSAITKDFSLPLVPFTLLSNNGSRFAAIKVSNNIEEQERNVTVKLYLQKQKIYATKGIPLIFPDQWVHTCLSLSSISGWVTLVVNGHEMVNSREEELLNNNTSHPKDLTGRLLLGCSTAGSGWYSYSSSVTNLAVFNSSLSLARMQRITAGGEKECGEEGDYLAWPGSKWTLKGSARNLTIPRKEPCAVEKSFQIFPEKVPSMEYCMQLCQKLRGRAPSVGTEADWVDLNEATKGVFNGSTAQGFWLPIKDEENEGTWMDFYTKQEIGFLAPFGENGAGGGKKENCASQLSDASWDDKLCSSKDRGCVCKAETRPYLTLRGLCSNTDIDSLYLPRNSKVENMGVIFIGIKGTQIKYSLERDLWELTVAGSNITGTSDASQTSYILGKANWTIGNDR